MRKLLLLSALILGMAALTTKDLKAPAYGHTTGDIEEITIPKRPGYNPYPGGNTPWQYEFWENPMGH